MHFEAETPKPKPVNEINFRPAEAGGTMQSRLVEERGQQRRTGVAPVSS
jgi:hypothetical protein